jgi:hypothetical protein
MNELKIILSFPNILKYKKSPKLDELFNFESNSHPKFGLLHSTGLNV